jgi:hypothetical protein
VTRACGYQGVWACACACMRVALLIQNETHVRHIVTSFVAPLAPANFSSLSSKRHDFQKKLLEMKCVFWFSLKIFSKIYLILRIIWRGSHKYENVFMLSTIYSCRIFMKSLNTKFHQNPSRRSRILSCGQTDMTTVIVTFRNFAKTSNINYSFCIRVASISLYMTTTNILFDACYSSTHLKTLTRQVTYFRVGEG